MQKTNFWKRLMSLFLALITVVGLLPLSAMVTPAQALTINGGTGPAPDTMTNNSHRTWKEYNSPTLKPSKVVPRIFDFKVGDLGVSPGFCADHSKDISWTVEWSDPVPITGTKYEVIMPLLAAYCQKWFYSRMLDELHPEWTVTQKKDQARQDLGARSYYYTEDDRVTASAFVQAAAWMAGAGQLTDLSDHAQQLLIARERNLTMETIYKHVNETDEEVAGWINDSIQKYADGEYGQWEAYLYTPSGGLQPVITVLPPDDLTTIPRNGWIKIDKTDLSGKNLKGATFGIYLDSGHENKVAEFTTTDDEWTYVDVTDYMTADTQTFYLKELSAPDDYVASTSGYTVTVNSANNNTQDTAAAVNGGAPIKNSPVQKPEGVVQKVDLHDNPIGPAVFRFVSLDNKINKKIRSDANGDLKLQWTDPDGENYLPPGEYTVTEDTPPLGYEKTDESQNLLLWIEDINGTPTAMHSGPLTFKNKPLHSILIQKVDPSGRGLPGAVFDVYCNGAKVDTITTGADGTFLYVRFPHSTQDYILIETLDIVTRAPIPGAQYTVTNMNGDLVGTYTANNNGVVEVGPLTPGFYVVKQVTAPEGYSICTETQTIEVISGRVMNCRFVNEKLEGIIIEAVDQETHTGLANVMFEIYNDRNIQVAHGATDASGMFSTGTLPAGRYTIRQMATPDGYTAVETMKNVTLGNEPVTVVFEQKAHTSLIIELVDDTTGAPLANSRFRVESEDGSYTTTVVTGEDGTATVGNLAAGRYMVAQETAPEGYVQDSSYQWAVIRQGETTSLRFTNKAVSGLVIRALDRDTQAPLAGATFEISEVNGKLIKTVTTDNTGIVTIAGLQPG